MEDLSNLNIGDKVILNILSWDYSKKLVKTVEKITPSGLIRVGGDLFYKDGHVRGKSGARIQKWSQEEENKINQENFERRVKTACINVFEKCAYHLTYEQAVAILKILKKDENEIQ